MLWACILLPQLALDAVLRRCPDPDAPLALVTGPAQLRSLHAVNATAAAAGLRPGQRLVAAQALLPGFAMVEHAPAREAAAQQFLAGWAYRHSSLVSTAWPGAIVLEARASFRLFGPWPRFERRLREELSAQAGAGPPAPSPTAAAPSSRSGAWSRSPSRRPRSPRARRTTGMAADAGTTTRRSGLHAGHELACSRTSGAIPADAATAPSCPQISSQLASSR